MKLKLAVPTIHPYATGFTLLELMIAIGIVGILLGLAVPSFTDIMRRNQITAQTNSLVSSLALARSEAIKRGVSITICPRTGSTCTGSTNWSAGWQVIDDRNGDGDVDDEDTLLQVSPTAPQGIVVTGDASTLVFQRTGEAAAKRIFNVSKSGCGALEKREVTVELTGRTHLTKKDC